ncbi:MAG: hypothetical protein ABIP33_07940 [Pseudolysinimonas sp.]
MASEVGRTRRTPHPAHPAHRAPRTRRTGPGMSRIRLVGVFLASPSSPQSEQAGRMLDLVFAGIRTSGS